jgi:hypothetical protein
MNKPKHQKKRWKNGTKTLIIEEWDFFTLTKQPTISACKRQEWMVDR